MSPGQPLEQVLRRCARRMGWLGGLRRAGWILVAGLLLGELGLSFGASGAFLPLFIAALAVGALAALLLSPTPPPALVAALLDARLQGRATLSTAAEALGGQHPRFAGALQREAQSLLAGATPSQLVPFRLPSGLILGLAGALLLPFLLPQGSLSRKKQASLASLPSLSAPQASLGEGPAGTSLAPPPEGVWELSSDPSTGAGESQLLDALPLDEAEAFRQRLSEVLAGLPARPAEGGEAAVGGASVGAKAPSALEEALAQGASPRALELLEALAAQAGDGLPSARAELRALAKSLGPPGGGAAPGTHQPASPEPSGSLLSPSPALAGGSTYLPWELREVCRRYFAPSSPAGR